MTAVSIILIGGGEHARVVGEAVRSQQGAFDLLGFVDPEECRETVERLGLQRLGDDFAVRKYPHALGVLGIGATGPSSSRAAIAERITEAGLRGWATIVHRTACVSPSAHVSPGSVVMAAAVINSGAQLGVHCVLNTGAILEHDVHLGDHVFVGPGVVVGGGARIDSDAFIGLGAIVRDHVRVGAGALVAMGAVVVNDVYAGAHVMGIPARVR